MATARIWAVRAGAGSQVDHIFTGRNQLAVNFVEAGGDASTLPASRAAFKEAFGRSDMRAEAIPILAGQLFRFVHEMRIGDRVIYPRKIDRVLMWGEVAGPYVYDPEGAPDFAHRRGVRWLAQMSRDAFSQDALYELGSVLTLFEVKSFADEFLLRFETPAAPDEKAGAGEDETEEIVVKDIVETTRDFIFKRLKTDLKGFPLEAFVADLFRGMGYRAHTTRAVRDEGVDVIAHRDELGVEPPILKIQVKAQESNISADQVKAFCAMVNDRDVGVYITIGGYTAPARDFARTKGNLRLIDGVEFIDLIQKHYDRLDHRHRQLIPLRQLLVPDVALDEG
jgi:restriction system protein